MAFANTLLETADLFFSLSFSGSVLYFDAQCIYLWGFSGKIMKFYEKENNQGEGILNKKSREGFCSLISKQMK